jgi:predicted RNase H-like nuclease (RuvC/YqgF family)
MTKKKSTQEAKVVGKVDGLSDQTLKSQVEQYKNENKNLLEQKNELEKEVAWLTEELAKLRRTNQSLIRGLHGR